ncbi:MAG: hypothetical protein NW206_18000 [Hyphomonadaceae bacterium]|nr:hypothetical protein [Hyphomonadaceae bacterium]
MRVYNFHCRRIGASADAVGAILGTLGAENDRLWPWEHFDAMKFAGTLAVGAKGGHGPVRYEVTEIIPARLIAFEFNAEKGVMKQFRGRHWFEVVPLSESTCEIRHLLWADVQGAMWWLWWILVETLHDATVEAALAKAELEVTGALKTPFKFTPRQKLWKLVSGERGAYDKSRRRAAWLAAS